MNTHRNLRSQNKPESEAGFSMVTAMGLGLIMLLVGTTLIVRSQQDHVDSVTQDATARSLRAAEAGISQIQSIVNQFRPIAVYNACQSWQAGTDGTLKTIDDTCGDSGTTASWNNPGTTTNPLIADLNTGCGPNGNGYTEVPPYASRAWRTVDSSNATKGQYRLIDYTYASGVGTLIVEGQANQTNNSGVATSRLSVKMPVTTPSDSTGVPGLWIGSSSVTDMGNDKVKGNIIINSCTLPTGPGEPTTANLSNTTQYKLAAIPQEFPDTPNLPPNSSLYSLSNPWTTLPRAGDQAYNGRYSYIVDDLITNGNKTMTIQSGAKVDIFVRGNMDLGGTPNINQSGTSDQVRILGNKYTDSTQTSTKYGCGTGQVIGTTCPTLQADFNGTGTIKAFAFAPDATGGVAGGGNTGGNFIGSVWIKDWDKLSNNDKIKIDASLSYADYGFANFLDRETIGALTEWEQQASQ